MSQVAQDPRDAGREAARRGAWGEAYEHLSAADKDGALDGEELELLAQAALWTGHLGASIEFAERAYARFSDAGENLRAAMTASGRGDYDAALEHIQRALDIATRHHDKDLLAQATLREGVARLNKGDVYAGLSLTDEVAASAVAGELNPMSTAIIYCNAIDACRDLADYSRAA